MHRLRATSPTATAERPDGDAAVHRRTAILPDDSYADPSASAGSDVDDALRLPDPPPPARRGGVPLLAAVVPILAAAGLWAITRTSSMLWFAALGPLIAAAGYVDAVWAQRRARRHAARDAARARRTVAAAVVDAHARERARLWGRHPDVARAVTVASRDDLWRGSPDPACRVVVGHGPTASAVRVTGGGPAGAALRRRAQGLDDAPITVTVDGGIAVIGPDSLAAAVVRSLVLQLCLALPPDRLAVRPAGAAEPWCAALPHAHRVGVAAERRTLTVCAPGARADPSADIVIARAAAGSPVPSGCRTVLSLTGVDTAHVSGGGIDADVHVEGLSAGQAAHIAAVLARHARDAFAGGAAAAAPLSELLHADAVAGPPGPGAPSGAASGLPAVIGMRDRAPFIVDLVGDGPHAVIAGMTGSGKSELLTTWITALCARHPPSRLLFVLADFKGGTAFDALTALPHVTGVITDLDGDGARRALHSLRAELRHRESEIVRVGARDIDGTALPRLVIVVDEFAALAASHPDLQDLFTDIAARGRALGMHVILGTQRAAGTFRDALLANCPLRVSLRVSDPADSRTLLGCDDAARLPGDTAGRGIALVRRAADPAPCAVRVALASARLIAQTAKAAPGPSPRRPWLPALPATLDLAAVRARAPADRHPGDVLLGIADEPDRQRQSAVLLRTAERGLCVVGAPGSGRSSLLDLVAEQVREPVWVGPDPEQAWDALATLADEPRPGAVVLVDDVDALLGRYPADYAHEVVARLERIIHGAGDIGIRVLLTAQRMNAATARVVDLIPRRALLALPSRSDHVAAGGDAHQWRDRRPPGRALLDAHAVQFALPGARRCDPHDAQEGWMPSASVTGVVLRPGPLHRRVIAAARAARAHVVALDDVAAVLDDRGGRPRTRADRPVVAVGDAEQWQREWRTLAAVRDHHELLIDAAGAAEFRLLTTHRELPPYCVPGRGRGWSIRAGQAPRRVMVPEPDGPA